MKIWVDDIRTPPDDDWIWYKNSHDFLEHYYGCGFEPDCCNVEVLSLDHDLGGDDTSRPIVLAMCERGTWPVEVRVHSANPVGVEWLEGMIERYKT